MRFIDDNLIARWRDGSIPMKAKGELIHKFLEEFDYKGAKSNSFNSRLGKRAQPTPDQHEYLTKMINEYWGFYNPGAVVEAVDEAAQTSGKNPINAD